MSNWEPGDLALCVKTGKLSHLSPNGVRCTHGGGLVPPRGSVRTVVRIEQARTDRGTVFSCGCLNLVFADGSLGAALRFTKVTPGTDVQAFEEPRRVPVPARERQDA